MKIQYIINDILIRGLDDWIQAAEICSVVLHYERALNDVELRNYSLRVVNFLIAEDWMQVGDVFESGFVAWGLSSEQTMARIEANWELSLPGGPGLGEVFWLNLTHNGEQQALKLCDQDVNPTSQPMHGADRKGSGAERKGSGWASPDCSDSDYGEV